MTITEFIDFPFRGFGIDMNTIVSKLLDRFYADVNAKLTERLTEILGHVPQAEELRGRCRKEVVWGGSPMTYYLDDVPFLKVSGPTLAQLPGGAIVTWTISPYPAEALSESKPKE